MSMDLYCRSRKTCRPTTAWRRKHRRSRQVYDGLTGTDIFSHFPFFVLTRRWGYEKHAKRTSKGCVSPHAPRAAQNATAICACEGQSGIAICSHASQKKYQRQSYDHRLRTLFQMTGDRERIDGVPSSTLHGWSKQRHQHFGPMNGPESPRSFLGLASLTSHRPILRFSSTKSGVLKFLYPYPRIIIASIASAQTRIGRRR